MNVRGRRSVSKANKIGSVRINAKLMRVLANQCCSGKAKSITYSGCVFVALVIQHAMRMRRIIL